MSWNKTENMQTTAGAADKGSWSLSDSSRPSKFHARGIWAGLIVIVLGLAIVWLVFHDETPDVISSVRPKSSAISEVNVSTSATDTVALEKDAVVRSVAQEPSEEERLLQGKDTNEWIVVTDPYTGKKYLSKLMRPGLKNLPPPYFKNGALNIIDALQYGEMGDPMIGVQIDGRFMKEFEQALIDGVDADEPDDNEDRLSHKAAMRETLADLRQQIKGGADVQEIFRESLKERRRISALRDAMREERSRMRSEGATEEEVVEFERACNKKLEELGAKPMITKELMIKKGLERKGLLF